MPVRIKIFRPLITNNNRPFLITPTKGSIKDETILRLSQVAHTHCSVLNSYETADTFSIAWPNIKPCSKLSWLRCKVFSRDFYTWANDRWIEHHECWVYSSIPQFAWIIFILFYIYCLKSNSLMKTAGEETQEYIPWWSLQGGSICVVPNDKPV